MTTETELSLEQRKALGILWCKYGNGGSCHTPANHKFIQAHLLQKLDDAKRYEHLITKECKDAFDRILNNDYHELRRTMGV